MCEEVCEFGRSEEMEDRSDPVPNRAYRSFGVSSRVGALSFAKAISIGLRAANTSGLRQQSL